MDTEQLEQVKAVKHNNVAFSYIDHGERDEKNIETLANGVYNTLDFVSHLKGSQLDLSDEAFRDFYEIPDGEDKALAKHAGYTSLQNAMVPTPATVAFTKQIATPLQEALAFGSVFQTQMVGVPGFDTVKVAVENDSGEAVQINLSTDGGKGAPDRLNKNIITFSADTHLVRAYGQGATILAEDIDSVAALQMGVTGGGMDLITRSIALIQQSCEKAAEITVAETLVANRSTEGDKGVKDVTPGTPPALNDADTTATFLLELASSLWGNRALFKPMVFVLPPAFAGLLVQKFSQSPLTTVGRYVREAIQEAYQITPQFVFSSLMTEGSDNGVYCFDNRPDNFYIGMNQRFTLQSPFQEHNDISNRGTIRPVGIIPLRKSAGVYSKYTT